MPRVRIVWLEVPDPWLCTGLARGSEVRNQIYTAIAVQVSRGYVADFKCIDQIRGASAKRPIAVAVESFDLGTIAMKRDRRVSEIQNAISGKVACYQAGSYSDLLESRHSTHKLLETGNETEFGPDSCYEDSAVVGGALDEKWTSFERSLKTESRYFSRTAMRILDEIFHDLDVHRTYQGSPIIVDAGLNAAIKTLYRARVFQSKESLWKALECPEISIGPPPSIIAAAGRMNAQGIPVFYGATDPKVALAEVRPPVGSKVVVAQFDITRPLRLLDVESMQQLSVDGSPFDSMYLVRRQRAQFLRGLSERITMPVMPDDEKINYVATQVIAEYLASLEKPTLDGMIFRSVQAAEGMKNVVLFHKAAVVGE